MAFCLRKGSHQPVLVSVVRRKLLNVGGESVFRFHSRPCPQEVIVVVQLLQRYADQRRGNSHGCRKQIFSLHAHRLNRAPTLQHSTTTLGMSLVWSATSPQSTRTKETLW